MTVYTVIITVMLYFKCCTLVLHYLRDSICGEIKTMSKMLKDEILHLQGTRV